jgi:pimeloyl-ACP methyl ester carboxylesterase
VAASGAAVVAVDLRGHGESGFGDACFAPVAMAAISMALAAATQEQRVESSIVCVGALRVRDARDDDDETGPRASAHSEELV